MPIASKYLVACCCLSLTALCSGGGVIEGRVTLPKAISAPVVAKRYEIVSHGGIVATNPPLAVVYVEGDFARPSVQPVEEMSQKGLMFVPALLPIGVGTKVEFPNMDEDTYHNIFSYSAAKRFDLGRYRSDEKPVPSQVFETPGLITLRCDIHEHMRGIILVLNTPFFVLTDAEGRFRLTGIPAGRHTLKAWLNSKTTLEQPVQLEADAVVHADFP